MMVHSSYFGRYQDRVLAFGTQDKAGNLLRVPDRHRGKEKAVVAAAILSAA
jgi:hypothetical protein